jgi:hypothetical protein
LSENDLQKKIVKVLNSYEGTFFTRIHGSPYQRMGLPDVVGVWQGTFYGLEVKLPGKERNLTAIQQRTLDKINAAGGIGEMVTTVDQAEEAVFGGKRKQGTRHTLPNS